MVNSVDGRVGEQGREAGAAGDEKAEKREKAIIRMGWAPDEVWWGGL